MIASQSGNNCVSRGLSTMRLALGYRNGLPDFEIGNGSMTQSDILENVGKWFPNHSVYVIAPEHEYSTARHMDGNCFYLGESCNLDCDNYLIGFAYYYGDSDDSHFVIGAPCVYGDMQLAIVVYVELI